MELNFQTFLLFREVMPSHFFNPGYSPGLSDAGRDPPDHPLVRGLSRAAKSYDPSDDRWIDRPIDLFFIATSSPERDETLARLSPFLAARPTCVYYVSNARPLAAELNDTRPQVTAFVARRSKIVLNLHRDEANYFEWHRMILHGVWHRALVISAPCLSHPLFKPGVHYLEEEPRGIPSLVKWLVETREGRLTAERVRNEAFATLVERNTSQRSSLGLAGFIVGTAAAYRESTR
jgi:hypothetical protein